MPILGKSKAKAAPQSIRVEKVVIQPKSKPRSALVASSKGNLRASSSAGTVTSSPRLSPNPRLGVRHSASPYPSSSDERKRIERKRKAIHSTPRDSPIFDDDDADESDDDNDDPFGKRRKFVSQSRDPNRRVRHKKAFGDEVRDAKIIHAADLASIKTGCVPALGAKEDEVALELQYPSRCQPER
ncbi:hypothetical protein BX600DRAFT_215914 [Xylariales sp. PMI_506]|nr:hypothetical protein BX600DRAFT_215914 [Xylariales sp. PMI_506]